MTSYGSGFHLTRNGMKRVVCDTVNNVGGDTPNCSGSGGGGGSGTPANPVNSIQFNNAGSFGGSANLTWNGSTVAVVGSVSASYMTAALGFHLPAGAALSGSPSGLGSYLALDVNNNVILTASTAPLQVVTASLSGNNIAGTDCSNYFHFSSSWTASCDSLIYDDRKLIFAHSGTTGAGKDANIYWSNEVPSYPRFVVSSSREIGINIDGGTRRLYLKKIGNVHAAIELYSSNQTIFHAGGNINDNAEVFRLDGSDQSIVIPDDVKLNFGTDKDGSIRYDETGDNRLIVDGTNVAISGNIYMPEVSTGVAGSLERYVAADSTGKLVLTSSERAILTGSGVANRVTYWNGVESLSSSANLTFNGTTLSGSNVDIHTVDINDGTIDGTTIGASVPDAGTFTNVTVNGNLDTDADDISVFASLGANTASLGGSTSMIRVAGDLDVVGDISGSGKLEIGESITSADGQFAVSTTGQVEIGGGFGSTGVTIGIDGKTQISGELTSSAGVNLTGLSAASAISTSYLALDTSNNVVLTSSAGGGASTANRYIVTKPISNIGPIASGSAEGRLYFPAEGGAGDNAGTIFGISNTNYLTGANPGYNLSYDGHGTTGETDSFVELCGGRYGANILIAPRALTLVNIMAMGSTNSITVTKVLVHAIKASPPNSTTTEDVVASDPVPFTKMGYIALENNDGARFDNFNWNTATGSFTVPPGGSISLAKGDALLCGISVQGPEDAAYVVNLSDIMITMELEEA